MNVLDLSRLDGARALVTGASRGIGKAVATALADAGADVAVAARTTAALHDTARLIAERGHKAVALAGDLAMPGVAASIVDQAAAALGGLDVIVHNAGVMPVDDDLNPVMVPFQNSQQHHWENVITVNVNATAALCRAAHPYLAESDRASLVLMSSLAGLIGTPMMESYAASKAAQVSLARSLAVGWARQGIRVNALCPGWTRTDMTAFASGTDPLDAWLMSHVPMGRWAEVREVACAALFLASPASSFVTGHALVVDGGVAVPDGGLAGIPKPPSPFAAS